MECERKILKIKFQFNKFIDIFFKIIVVVCILIGLEISIFSYIAFMIALIYLFYSDNEKNITYMFFLLPFSNIFKANPNSSSFFTYLTIFLSLKLIVSKRTIEKRFLSTWIVLFIIQVFGCNMEITLLAKQATILLLVYGYFHCCKLVTKQIVENLSVGMLISCIVANMTAIFPEMTNYLRLVRAYEVSSDIYRFTALYSDPNYLSKTLIVLCVSLFILIQQKRIKSIYWFFILSFIVFGTQTISKSFFLMLAIVLLIFTVISIKNKHYGIVIVILLSCVIIVGLCVLNKITIFDNILIRLTSSDDLTTGRVDIWEDYIAVLIKNPVNLLFGFGISNSLELMSHNTYLEFLYHYGIFGTVVFLLSLNYAVNKQIRHRKIIYWLPAFFATIMAFFLSDLLMFDFSYNLILVISFLVENTESEFEKQGVVTL